MRNSRYRGRRVSPESPRVRFANERSRSANRRPSFRSPRISLSRDGLFEFYLLIFCGPLLLVAAGAVAIFAHDVAIPSLFHFIAGSFVYGIKEIWDRPTLIFALLFVLSLIWCFLDSKPSSNGTSNLRRGRDLGGLAHAQRQAQRYSERRRTSADRRY